MWRLTFLKEHFSILINHFLLLCISLHLISLRPWKISNGSLKNSFSDFNCSLKPLNNLTHLILLHINKHDKPMYSLEKIVYLTSLCGNYLTHGWILHQQTLQDLQKNYSQFVNSIPNLCHIYDLAHLNPWLGFLRALCRWQLIANPCYFTAKYF